MRLEVEITEAEIKDAIERKIRVAIADQTNQWGADNFIKAQVKAMWEEQVATMIQEQLADSEVIKEKIRTMIESKLKGQLAAVMRGKP